MVASILACVLGIISVSVEQPLKKSGKPYPPGTPQMVITYMQTILS